MQPRILYIDGCKEAHPVFAGYARQILGNVEVISAFDGEEGIEAYLSANSCFDMVITDYHLQKKNVTEVINAVKRLDKNIPIAVMKGINHDGLKQLNLNGAHVLISKPFEKEQLETILTAYLSR
jgi:CheY-like chemotaxis protein